MARTIIATEPAARITHDASPYAYDLLIFVGRFQPFHFGHLAGVHEAQRLARNVLVLVGSSNAVRSTRNPFTYEERQRMIADVLGSLDDQMDEHGLTVASRTLIKPLPDRIDEDAAWVHELETAVFETLANDLPAEIDVGSARIGLIGHSRENRSQLHATFPNFGSVDITATMSSHGKLLSSTSIRKRLFAHDLDGAIDALSPFGEMADTMPPAVRGHLDRIYRTAAFRRLVAENAGRALSTGPRAIERSGTRATTAGTGKPCEAMSYGDFEINANSNLILNTDSYKFSHWAQLPPNATGLSEYLEARGGPFATSRFFGLQSILIRHLMRPVTWADFEEARAIVPEHMASPDAFNERGWTNLIENFGGFAPVEIAAVPEGMDIPIHNVLMQVRNTNPAFPWFPTYVETILQQVWGPTTVATLSAEVHRVFRAALERSSDKSAHKLPFAIQDFGLRGVSSMETGAILGLANLVNGKGTDTVPALREARMMYGARRVAGYSIPAGEHSEILAWSKSDGSSGEEAYLTNLFDRFLRPDKFVAAPIDSYDSKHFVEVIIGETFRERIIRSGGTFVARPDSGDPAIVVPWVLGALAKRFGTTRNGRGFAVLHPSVRVIFGDGMTLGSVETTLEAVLTAGFSAENVTFGMGGGLLQKIDRDTQQFAVKASAIERDGRWIDIRKVSSDDPRKASKAGRLALVVGEAGANVSSGGALRSVPIGTLRGRTDLLRPVFRNGKLLVFQQWEDDVLKTAAANAWLQ